MAQQGIRHLVTGEKPFQVAMHQHHFGAIMDSVHTVNGNNKPLYAATCQKKTQVLNFTNMLGDEKGSKAGSFSE
jgi:hypothetical protein